MTVVGGFHTFTVTNGRAYRQSGWTYKAETTVDLAQVLQELELRAAHAEEACRAAERKAAEEKRQWENAMTSAKAAHADAHRAKILTDQKRGWQLGLELDDYLNAMRDHIDSITDTDNATEAIRWLEWATAYRESIDIPRLSGYAIDSSTERTNTRTLSGWLELLGTAQKPMMGATNAAALEPYPPIGDTRH